MRQCDAASIIRGDEAFSGPDERSVDLRTQPFDDVDQRPDRSSDDNERGPIHRAV